MKILDIDSLATVTRQLKVKGVLHDVQEITVQQFIDSISAAAKLDALAAAAEKGSNDPAVYAAGVNESVKAITNAVPSLSDTDVRSMGLTAMMTMLSFIRGEFDPQPTATAAGAQEGEGGGEAAEKKPT